MREAEKATPACTGHRLRTPARCRFARGRGGQRHRAHHVPAGRRPRAQPAVADRWRSAVALRLPPVPMLRGGALVEVMVKTYNRSLSQRALVAAAVPARPGVRLFLIADRLGPGVRETAVALGVSVLGLQGERGDPRGLPIGHLAIGPGQVLALGERSSRCSRPCPCRTSTSSASGTPPPGAPRARVALARIFPAGWRLDGTLEHGAGRGGGA